MQLSSLESLSFLVFAFRLYSVEAEQALVYS